MYPERGGLGVLPQKNFKKIGTKSCNSKHFWLALCTIVTHATRGYITVHLWIMYNLIADIKRLIFEKPGIVNAFNTGRFCYGIYWNMWTNVLEFQMIEVSSKKKK